MPSFDATQVQLLISQTQALPKPVGQAAADAFQQPLPSIEQPRSPQDANSHIRLGPNGPYVASPKRPFDDSDTDSPQRKFMRGESPLRGAAGRRMQNQSGGASGSSGVGGFAIKNYSANAPQISAPPALPAEVAYLLSILPNARVWDRDHIVRFEPTKVVDFLRGVDLRNARLPQ